MDRRIAGAAAVLATLSAVAVAVAVIRRRPVRPPAEEGTWEPVAR